MNSLAARIGFDLELAEVAAQSIFRPGDVRVLVGVDSYGHVGWNVCNTQCCHRPPLLDGLVVGSRARGHYCDGALTSLLSGHCSLGAVFLTVVADPRATDQNKGTRPVFRGVNPVAATTGLDLRSIQNRQFLAARRSQLDVLVEPNVPTALAR